MMKILTAVLLGASLAGCGAAFDREAMGTSLQEEQPLVFDDADILRIEQARPQLQFPIRLAVVPPWMFHRYTGWTDEPKATEGQREEILAWGDKLRQEGVVRDLILLPDLLQTMTPSGSKGYIKDIRMAAARVQADVVLVLRSTTSVDSYLNPLSLLDLTIVGMFLAPGHHKEALTIVEGLALDNRNQYVYFAGTAEGTGSTMAPLASIEARNAVRESRRAALRAFGDLLVKEARRIRDGAPGVPYSSPGQR
jgi:rhombotail lipoprotein